MVVIVESRDTDEILHFLIKSKKKEYTLKELSSELLISKPTLSAMLVYLRCQGYLKYRRKGKFGFYSLINK